MPPPNEDRLTIARIRQDAPAWTWRAERMGRNWQYVGTLGARTVTVEPYGMLAGEDMFATDWRVNEPSRSSASWALWCLAEGHG